MFNLEVLVLQGSIKFVDFELVFNALYHVLYPSGTSI